MKLVPVVNTASASLRGYPLLGDMIYDVVKRIGNVARVQLDRICGGQRRYSWPPELDCLGGIPQ